MHRRREIRCRAAVDAVARRGHARHFFKRRLHRLLHRMANLNILRPRLQMPRQGQKPGMLARAVVMDLARIGIRAGQFLIRLRIVRHMRAAAQISLGHPHICEPARHHLGVDMRALVTGARQCQLCLRQPCRIRSAAFNQRQCLQHFAGRSRENHRLRIAPCFDDRSPCITDDSVPDMGAFQQPATPQFHHRNCRFHVMTSLTDARFLAHGGFKKPQLCVMHRISSCIRPRHRKRSHLKRLAAETRGRNSWRL
ncbi:hypothetical protein GALL_494090 [mine drainage metagenome]|uniref:Uncharacterized protein n=1 Tax=mine drainage metagenome TaxID=410659 RepID=A0A1J5PDZ5_9ZZZZ